MPTSPPAPTPSAGGGDEGRPSTVEVLVGVALLAAAAAASRAPAVLL